jgi:hypothetical protein
MCNVPLQVVVNTFFYWNLSTGDILEMKTPTFQATMAPRIVKAYTVNWFGRRTFFFSFTVPLMWRNIYSRFKYTTSSPTARFCGMPRLWSECVLITFHTNSMDSTHQWKARRTQTSHSVSNTLARCHSYYHGLQSDSSGPTMPFYKIRATDESKIIAETMDSDIRQVQHCTQCRKHGAKSGEYQDVHLSCFRAEAYRFGRFWLITTDN